MTHPDFAFQVEEWDDRQIHVVCTMALCTNLLVAHAAYNEAVKHREGRPVLLRSGIRVIKQSMPPPQEPGSSSRATWALGPTSRRGCD